MKSARILVLDMEQAPYSLAVARSLASSGYEVDFGFPIGAHIFNAYSKFCSKYLMYPDPSIAPVDFRRRMIELSKLYDFIMPMMEKTELATSSVRAELEKNGATVPISNYDSLKLATDKTKILQIAMDLDIPIPETIFTDTYIDLEDVRKKLGLPFIIKVGSEIDVPPGAGERYFVVDKSTSIAQYGQHLEKFLRLGKAVIQKYVVGAGVGASFLFSANHELVAYTGHRRILEEFRQGGPSVIAETFQDSRAFRNGFKLLRKLGWQGVAMTEFKVSEQQGGELLFMELNPRFWGTLPLAISSGVDFPKLLVRNYVQRQLPYAVFPSKKRVYVNVFMFSKLLIETLTYQKDSEFAKRLLSVLVSSLKLGAVANPDFQYLDLKPVIARIHHALLSRLSKGKPARIGDVIFGPYLPYDTLTKIGVKSFIDLREESIVSKSNVPADATYHRVPILDDTGDPDSLERVVSAIKELRGKGITYVHCRLGRGRAPMAILAYLISQGADINEAYEVLYRIRPYSTLNELQMEAVYSFFKGRSATKP